jgi:hypothetical protein
MLCQESVLHSNAGRPPTRFRMIRGSQKWPKRKRGGQPSFEPLASSTCNDGAEVGSARSGAVSGASQAFSYIDSRCQSFLVCSRTSTPREVWRLCNATSYVLALPDMACDQFMLFEGESPRKPPLSSTAHMHVYLTMRLCPESAPVSVS